MDSSFSFFGATVYWFLSSSGSHFQAKKDLDAAFRRVHVYIWHALLATIIINQIAYILIRLSFGGNEGSDQHDIPSNMVVHIAQEILDNASWDPATLQSPYTWKIPPPE